MITLAAEFMDTTVCKLFRKHDKDLYNQTEHSWESHDLNNSAAVPGGSKQR